MSTTLVTPVYTMTKGNLQAAVRCIDPGARHPIKGTIHSPDETIDAAWDEGGYCLDNLPDCNLNVDDPSLAEIIEMALQASD